MAPICVHRAPPTPPDSTPGHIRSRDVLQEARRPDTDLPHTAVRARSHTLLQFTLHPNRLSTGLQGISARAMAPICVHRAPPTPPDSTPGHIRSRDVLQEARRPASHGPQSPVPYFLAIHLAPQSPFYRPPGHIRSRDGIDLCPSGTANPSRHRSKAYRPARCFAGRSPNCHARPYRASVPCSCKSPGTAIAILGASRVHRLARWHRFVSIGRHKPLQTSLQGTSARAMIYRKNPDLPHTAL